MDCDEHDELHGTMIMKMEKQGYKGRENSAEDGRWKAATGEQNLRWKKGEGRSYDNFFCGKRKSKVTSGWRTGEGLSAEQASSSTSIVLFC